MSDPNRPFSLPEPPPVNPREAWTKAEIAGLPDASPETLARERAGRRPPTPTAPDPAPDPDTIPAGSFRSRPRHPDQVSAEAEAERQRRAAERQAEREAALARLRERGHPMW